MAAGSEELAFVCMFSLAFVFVSVANSILDSVVDLGRESFNN